MHYVKRYVGYLVALALVIAAVTWVTGYDLKHVPPEHNQMAPKITVDDWIVVHKRDRNDTAFERHQIVRYAYRHPTYDESDQIFLGRILALEGERLAIKDGEVFVARPGSKGINFERDKVSEVYLDKDNIDKNLQFHEMIVPRGCVFLLTDNRTPIKDRKKIDLFLADSRYLGPISTRLIVGTINVE